MKNNHTVVNFSIHSASASAPINTQRKNPLNRSSISLIELTPTLNIYSHHMLSDPLADTPEIITLDQQNDDLDELIRFTGAKESGQEKQQKNYFACFDSR